MLLVWRVDIVGQAVMFLLRDSLKHHCQRLDKVFCLSFALSTRPLSPPTYSTCPSWQRCYLGSQKTPFSNHSERWKTLLLLLWAKGGLPGELVHLIFRQRKAFFTSWPEGCASMPALACGGLTVPTVTGPLRHAGQVAGWEARELAPAEQTAQNNHCSLSCARGGRRKVNVFPCAGAALLCLWRLSPVSAAFLKGQRSFALMTFPTHH